MTVPRPVQSTKSITHELWQNNSIKNLYILMKFKNNNK